MSGHFLKNGIKDRYLEDMQHFKANTIKQEDPLSNLNSLQQF